MVNTNVVSAAGSDLNIIEEDWTRSLEHFEVFKIFWVSINAIFHNWQ